MNSSISHYKMILRGIFDSTPIVPQTSTTNDGRPIISLTSNYLCLQCPVTVTEDECLKHGNKRSHRFCKLGARNDRSDNRLTTDTLTDIESRSGSLYCQICDDIVWDPTLEELRVRKVGTGSFSGTVSCN